MNDNQLYIFTTKGRYFVFRTRYIPVSSVMCRLRSILNLNRVHTLYELITLNVDRTVHMRIEVKIDKQHKQSTEYSHLFFV